MDVKEFIEHHGVKGMRWGVSRSRKQGSTSRGTDRTVFAKSPKNISSAELEKRIKRMETEKRYNELNKRDIGKGETLAAEILTNSGRTVATTIVTGAVLFGVKTALKKKFGSEVAGAITKRGK